MYELLPATAATKRMGPGSGAASTAGRRSTLVSTAAGDAARRPPTLGDGETMQDVQLSADVEALELRCNEPLRSRTTRLYSDKWHGSLPSTRSTSSPGWGRRSQARRLKVLSYHPRSSATRPTSPARVLRATGSPRRLELRSDRSLLTRQAAARTAASRSCTPVATTFPRR
ncbi:hypothetical protein EMIHUDRAFT_454244 [Emiliania huxleyi CCMP1516]|uniref:Uncharacterized protein n=2 Tax=Emiliania huxleyi TaxID=2903 RepID=A0A0D3KX25_EMIH1|nr:hypothetical protein EMIHUDRAFT_454244 [Emiliania huxleyi CCMP1516]EOD40310.1 hypothetical protein EMIHUDRAFT_454244 [Emiliania huxleyi CCMP1516]|eukprot:XP_005792739.1 hypothetical protein EMIHUDRAFT_454244 [Emiliania huxleyi CCMP1516]